MGLPWDSAASNLVGMKILLVALFSGTSWAATIVTSSVAIVGCVHVAPFGGPIAYTVTHFDSGPASHAGASCYPGDNGASASAGAGSSLGGLHAQTMQSQQPGSEQHPSTATALYIDSISFPFNGVIRFNVTITLNGVDDGGIAYSSASFLLNGTDSASLGAGFDIPPATYTKSWVFDVPFESGVPVPYQAVANSTSIGTYGSVEANSTLLFSYDLIQTPEPLESLPVALFLLALSGRNAFLRVKN